MTEDNWKLFFVSSRSWLSSVMLVTADWLTDDMEVMHIAGADPGFPVGGGANRPGGGATYEIANMKLRKFRAVGGRGAPPKSANA